MTTHFSPERLITTIDELQTRIMSFFYCTAGQTVYITGKNLGKIFHLLPQDQQDKNISDCMKHFCILIPSMDAKGLIFRAYASARGAEVRVTSLAVHDMIVGHGMVILLSMDDMSRRDPSLIGLETSQRDIFAQAQNYARSLWKQAHPIRYS